MKRALPILLRTILLACLAATVILVPISGLGTLWLVVLLAVSITLSLLQQLQPFSYARISGHGGAGRPLASLLPATFSLINLLCGVTAVSLALPAKATPHHAFAVLLFIMLGSIADALDGRIARRFGLQSDNGASLDSAIDLASFGLATSTAIFLHLTWASRAPVVASAAVAAVFFTCVHLRLARFTKHEEEASSQKTKRNFVGLPSPAAAVGALVACALPIHPVVLMLVLVIFALLMVSRFDYVSHANCMRLPLYRFLITPVFLGSTVLLTVLVPLGSRLGPHSGRILLVTAGAMLACFTLYVADGIRRGWVPSQAPDLENPTQARV